MSQWQPHLMGALVELRPLQPGDFAALFAIAADPAIWAQHPASDRYQEPVFRQFFDGALRSGGAFVVLDRATGAFIGSSRYDGYDATTSTVEIGWTFLARSHWGGRYNREMKRLMLEHAFQHVATVLFMVGERNLRSRIALERLGATWNGDCEERSLNGVIVTHVTYRIERAAYRPPV